VTVQRATSAVRTDRIDDERFAFPMPDRMSKPGGVEILRMLPPVHEYPARQRTRLEHDDDALGGPRDLQRKEAARAHVSHRTVRLAFVRGLRRRQALRFHGAPRREF